MKNTALVVIDLQNDITKNYREIIENVNEAIDWAVRKDLWVVYEGCGSSTSSTAACLWEQGRSSPAPMAGS